MRRSWKSGDKTPVISAIINRLDFALKTYRSSRDCSGSLLKEKTDSLKLIMLTSSQWPGVLIFISKQRK